MVARGTEGPSERPALRLRARMDHMRQSSEIEGRIGVSPALYEQLFEPFVSDRAAGTGVGLSTSNRVAEAHQGTLTYTVSDLGGACFTLLLPRHQEAASLA